MSPQKHSLKHVVSGILICCVFSALSLLAIINRQYIVDQITVWQFTPGANVVSLVEKAGMNDYGKFIYLASQPKLDGTQTFNTECERIEVVTSILGCYNDYKIYVYDVTDTQLDGIREVTATHEALHAVYARLSDSDKEKVDALIEIEYKKLENNDEFKSLMAFYARTEPGQRYNELHSIIGTEVPDISTDLENYYSKYFSDRQKVVALNDKYNSVFETLNKRADEISAQLNITASIISGGVSEYNSSVQALNSDIAAFNARADSGDFISQSQFNSQRAALMARVSSLETLRQTVESNIEKYDGLLEEYNSIASESKKINNNINSILAPAPSV